MAAAAGNVDLDLDADVLLLHPRRCISHALVVVSSRSCHGCCCQGVEEEEGASQIRGGEALRGHGEEGGEKKCMVPRQLLAGEEEGEAARRTGRQRRRQKLCMCAGSGTGRHTSEGLSESRWPTCRLRFALCVRLWIAGNPSIACGFRVIVTLICSGLIREGQPIPPCLIV